MICHFTLFLMHKSERNYRYCQESPVLSRYILFWWSCLGDEVKSIKLLYCHRCLICVKIFNLMRPFKVGENHVNGFRYIVFGTAFSRRNHPRCVTEVVADTVTSCDGVFFCFPHFFADYHRLSQGLFIVYFTWRQKQKGESHSNQIKFPPWDYVCDTVKSSFQRVWYLISCHYHLTFVTCVDKNINSHSLVIHLCAPRF